MIFHRDYLPPGIYSLLIYGNGSAKQYKGNFYHLHLPIQIVWHLSWVSEWVSDQCLKSQLTIFQSWRDWDKAFMLLNALVSEQGYARMCGCVLDPSCASPIHGQFLEC